MGSERLAKIAAVLNVDMQGIMTEMQKGRELDAATFLINDARSN